MPSEYVRIASAAAALLAPFTPYLVEAGKKFAANAGDIAWEQAETLWKKLMVKKKVKQKVTGAAYRLSSDPKDQKNIRLMAESLAQIFQKDPQLTREVKDLLGGEPGVMKVLASSGSWVEDIEQEMTGPGSMLVEAKGNSVIKGVRQVKKEK